MAETLSTDDAAAVQSAVRSYLFVAFQAATPLAGGSRHALDDVDEILIGRGSPTVQREVDGAMRRLVLRFPDPRLSSTHCRIHRHAGALTLTDAVSKNGSFINDLRIDGPVTLVDRDLLELGSSSFIFRRLRGPTKYDDVVDRGVRWHRPGWATLLPDLEARLSLLERAAPADLPILVLGDTGTGKELMARAAHELSGRTGAFVAVNCAALTPTLIEAELFGHKKGAFSGASSERIGLVRAADHGTLFLDEIGELPPPAQAALLRVLQEREVLPVGGVRPVAVDVRIVSATHRNLDRMVAADRFRADLLARIAGFSMRLPALRDRREDVGLLTTILLRQLLGTRAENVRFDTSAARHIINDPWKLNIRGLQKTLAAAALVAAGERIELEHLGAAATASTDSEPARSAPPRSALSTADRALRDRLAALLAEHEGNISAVAREMGKARFQVRRWIKRFGLDQD